MNYLNENIHLFVCIYILLLFIIKISSKESNKTKLPSSIAVLPFKTFKIPNKNNEDSFSSRDYFDIIHSSKIYLEIEIGQSIKNKTLSKEEESIIPNKKQFLPLFIIIDDINLYIVDNYFYDKKKKEICRYSTELSTLYQVNSSYKFTPNNLSKQIYASDYFKIFSNTLLNDYNMIKIDFKHLYDPSKNISFACGKVGLIVPKNKLYLNSDINFIGQIHKALENVDVSFTFKFNDNGKIEGSDEGLLIIGAGSYEKNRDDLISIYSIPNNYGSDLNWRFEMDQITIGDNFFEFSNEQFMIKADIEGIEIPYSFYELLKRTYFNYYFKKKICQYDIVNNNYLVFSCNSSIFTEEDIKKFPQIDFLKSQLGFNFSFSGKELFYKNNNAYFFKMVAYLQRFRTDFLLGRIFLKKYKVIFNSDSKSMLFYDIKMQNEEIHKNKEKNNIALAIVIYFISGILFLVIGLFLGRKFCLLKRRIYANELEDDNYVYESKNKVIKKEQKLIEL